MSRCGGVVWCVVWCAAVCGVVVSGRTQPDWMREVYQSTGQGATRLRDVILPGTHNSATAEMIATDSYAKKHDLRVGKQLVFLWSKNQARTILRQLMDGIRYLDLRVENHPTRGWLTYHGLLSIPLSDVIDDLARFATAHPTEVVIVDFQHMVDFSDADHGEVMTYLTSHPHLSPRLAPRTLGSRATLQSFWDSDTNVVLLYKRQDAGGKLWPQWISNPWPNTQSYDVMKTKLLTNIKTRSENYGFYVSQAILTPDSSVVVQGLLNGLTSIQKYVEAKVSPKIPRLMTELDRTARSNGRTLNIVIVDFYEKTGVVGEALRLNRINAGVATPQDATTPPPTTPRPRNQGLSPLNFLISSLFDGK